MKHNEKLDALKEKALHLMKSAGFPLTEKIDVVVDETLPYMGYTTAINGQPTIVVSGDALKGDMALNLLIHEMSHQYHIQISHPSHDDQLLTSIIAWVMHGRAVLPYQEKILHSIINNIEDLYADDISFAIFDKNENLNQFFMGWIHQPVKAKSIEDRWENAEKLLSAAFAEGNLKRHHIKDTDDLIQKAIQEFLTQCEPKVASEYDFFRDFMVNLPKELTEKEFEKLLTTYLSKFLKLINI